MSAKSYISIEKLQVEYERHKDYDLAEIKPWSIKVRDKEGNVTAWYLVPLKDRIGSGIIPQSTERQRRFKSKTAPLPRTISKEHRAMLDRYVVENGCTIRDAVELAIERLVNRDD